jgi:DNA polymerase I-like protein with 3'-5' exonuclease and polymerase domains
LIKNELFAEDAERGFTQEEFPKRLWGSHSLKAWGLRLSDFKDDYSGGWEEFSEEMLSYCVQDTAVTLTLYKALMKTEPSEHSIYLEHRMAQICREIGNNGWTFDGSAAAELYAELSQKRHEIEDSLKDLFPPWEVTEDFYPKRDNKTLGYKKDELFIKSKTVYFNAGSRQHIQKCLEDKYNWKPKTFTESGQAKIDEKILNSLPFPEAKKLGEFFLLQKRIGMLAEGNGSWMKKVSDDGRLRHTIVSNACTSSRAAHRSPNLGQVPSAGSPYGKECRSLFGPPKGWVMTGVDLSGIEARALASYLHPYDGGEYCEVILEGDIHTFNQKAAGLKTRSQAKTWLYATLFGAGDALIGQIAGGNASLGRRLKQNYDRAVPAFATLRKRLQQAYKRGYIKGIDGRKLKIRSEHRCLSQLLQSCGSIVSKQWVMMTFDEIKKQHGDDAFIMGWIHDEMQIACRNEEVAENVGNIARRVAQEAGVALGLKIPIAAEHTVGKNWSHTH